MFFCNVDIGKGIICTWKGIPPKKHANICLLSLFFALNINRVHIQVSVDVCYTHVSKRHFLNDGNRNNQPFIYFP